jgi:hypothetical protein
VSGINAPLHRAELVRVVLCVSRCVCRTMAWYVMHRFGVRMCCSLLGLQLLELLIVFRV